MTDEMAQQKLFLHEPDLISHLVEYLSTGVQSSTTTSQLIESIIIPSVSEIGRIPFDVQTAALAALDSMAHYKSQLSTVLSHLGASTNYGILMRVCRASIAAMIKELNNDIDNNGKGL